VGTHRGSPDSGLSRHTDDVYHANLRRWREKGWDPMLTIKNLCRVRGWEFHAYVRVEAFATHYPLNITCGLRSDFFEGNPQFHCRDKEGSHVMRLSYANLEVQDHMLELFREIIEYEPDGLCLAFIRGVPLVLYETVMVDGFIAEYHVDPRTLDENDPRWLRYQADIINSFMVRVKAQLKPGQRLSAIIPGNLEDCARWGMDPSFWVQEGIVDDLLPTGQKFTPEDVHIDDPHNLDFDSFRELTGKDDYRVIPMLYPWSLFANDYHTWRKLIYDFLDAGADGYAVWDGNASEERFSGIADIGLEPRKPLDAFKDGRHPKVDGKKDESVYVSRRLLTLNGYRFDRYHHFEIV
jgi:hypothetical protein